MSCSSRPLAVARAMGTGSRSGPHGVTELLAWRLPPGGRAHRSAVPGPERPPLLAAECSARLSREQPAAPPATRPATPHSQVTCPDAVREQRARLSAHFTHGRFQRMTTADRFTVRIGSGLIAGTACDGGRPSHLILLGVVSSNAKRARRHDHLTWIGTAWGEDTAIVILLQFVCALPSAEVSVRHWSNRRCAAKTDERHVGLYKAHVRCRSIMAHKVIDSCDRIALSVPVGHHGPQVFFGCGLVEDNGFRG